MTGLGLWKAPKPAKSFLLHFHMEEELYKDWDLVFDAHVCQIFLEWKFRPWGISVRLESPPEGSVWALAVNSYFFLLGVCFGGPVRHCLLACLSLMGLVLDVPMV